MSHRVLSHTADTGVEAMADSFPALLEELLTGMFGLMADIEKLTATRWGEARLQADTRSDLVVDTLSEALFWSEVEDLLPCAFAVEEVPGERVLELRLGGVPIKEAEVVGPAIKAVTYHGLAVEERPGGWYGRVFFDV